MKLKLILLLILLLATFLRFYKIDQIPPALSWDEVSVGYDAYSILKTGKDQWGQVTPFAFKSFGEYKYPFHIYASAISIYFFGLNEFAVRFPAALFGVVNIFLLYLLVFKLFKNQFIALTAAFLLTISPWHIQFSRIIWETNFALFFFLLGLYFFFESIQKKKTYLLIITSILFGLDIFTYNAPKVFILLFLPVLLFSQKTYLSKQKKIVFLVLIIFVGFVLINLFDSRLSGLNRFKQLDFNQADVINTFSYHISKVYSLGRVELTLRQYILYFSPKFLFESGDANYRHSTQVVGEVYWIELFLIPFGIFFIFKKDRKLLVLILGWLLIAPIPGSFTIEAPHAARGMFVLGVWQILVASGMYYLYSIFKDYKRYLVIILYVLLFACFIIYFKYYLHQYSNVSSKYWQYGYKQAVEYIDKNYQNYDLIVITRADGEPQIFTLFYLKYDPQRYQTDKNLIRVKIGDWIQVLKFDKFYFPNLGTMGTRYENIVKQNPGQKILFIGKPGDFPAGQKILLTIHYLNGETAFEAVDNSNKD